MRIRSSGRAIHLGIIERGERDNHSNSKRFLTRNEMVGKHAPSALRVADAHGAGKPIDGNGKLHAILENFVSQSFGQFDAPRAAVMALCTVGNIGPAFQKDAALPVWLQSRITQSVVR